MNSQLCFLLMCLIVVQICPLINSMPSSNNYKTSNTEEDPSMASKDGIFEEFRQPLHLIKRGADIWSLPLRPSAFTFDAHRKKMLAIKPLREKRGSDENPYVMDYKKQSRELARLRQRFFNLL